MYIINCNYFIYMNYLRSIPTTPGRAGPGPCQFLSRLGSPGQVFTLFSAPSVMLIEYFITS